MVGLRTMYACAVISTVGGDKDRHAAHTRASLPVISSIIGAPSKMFSAKMIPAALH